MVVVTVITRERTESKIVCCWRRPVVLANVGPDREFAALPVRVERPRQPR